jgi:ParB family chromosome partitioning protein
MSSKRQSDYLKSLLASPEPAPAPIYAPPPPVISRLDGKPQIPAEPAPTASQTGPTRNNSLLARESALARIANGEVKQVTQLSLNPARVRIWKGNARLQQALNEETCADLIDAILAEGGQKVPAIVRRVDDDPAFDYEVIAGTRRHWAISWLRANNYPDMLFLAQVHTLDDESAFRLSDIENRARKDVSDFERACNYRDALTAHYGGRQNRMAERLRLSKGWLSKMLTVASLPDWTVAAFASPAEIQLKSCYPLAQRIAAEADGFVLQAMQDTAERLVQRQDSRRIAQQPGIPAAEVVQELLHAHEAGKPEEVLFASDSAHGRRALTVLSSNRNGVTIRLHAGSGATEAEIARLVREALASLSVQGKGLQA